MNGSFYYYILLFATFTLTFSFVPLLFEIIKTKIAINIPYSSLLLALFSLIIFMFVSISKKYYFHLLFYIIGFISLFIIAFLKKSYDKKIQNILMNIPLEKTQYNQLSYRKSHKS
jgi:uncharacterized protein with PQ loop repeat